MAHVRWLTPASEFDVKFVRGDPWDFFMKYSSDDNLNFILNTLRSALDSGQLHELGSPPKRGDYVVAVDGAPFRGYLMDNPMPHKRVKTLNIDEAAGSFIHISKLYAVPSSLVNICAQSIRCSVLTHDFHAEKLWNRQLQHEFTSVLNEYELKVKVVGLDSSDPPKCSVEITGIMGESLVDLTKWILSIQEDLSSCSNIEEASALVDIVKSPELFRIGLEKSPHTLAFPSSHDTKNSDSESDSLELKFPTGLNEEYAQNDDRKFCYYFLRDGHCTKKMCRKLHEKPEVDRWTHDEAPVFTEAFNTLVLPEVGDVVPVEVTVVIRSNMFYAHLPEENSDTGSGVLHRYSDLERDMNDPNNIALYSLTKSDPAPGSVLLGINPSYKKWCRVKILSVDDFSAEVFFVDLGVEKEIPFGNLREIPPKFLHLPFQAVLVRLDGCPPVPEGVGLDFLTNLIKGQKVMAHVVQSDCFENLIVAIVTTEEGLNVNDTVNEAIKK